MIVKTVEYISNFFEELNIRLSLDVNCKFKAQDKGRFPISRENGLLVVVPNFFNHPELNDDVRTMLMIELYSVIYLDKNNDGHLEINPGFMARGICNELKMKFIPDDKIEQNLRMVRRKLYNDSVNSCYFEVGREVRESAFVRYLVTNITRETSERTIITVKPTGFISGKPETTFTEEELYNLCCNFKNLEDEKVDMRRNLYIISGPSGAGKDTVVKQLMKQLPDANKTISITTRNRRDNEVDGVDYYYISKEQFYRYQNGNELVEYELYDGSYYGTLYSEIEKYPADKPLILVIDVRGKRNVMMHYPMAKSIFISPPSFEVLKERIISRNQNTPDEIEHRLKVAKEELEKSHLYDHIVVNEQIDECVKNVAGIILQNNV